MQVHEQGLCWDSSGPQSCCDAVEQHVRLWELALLLQAMAQGTDESQGEAMLVKIILRQKSFARNSSTTPRRCYFLIFRKPRLNLKMFPLY